MGFNTAWRTYSPSSADPPPGGKGRPASAHPSLQAAKTKAPQPGGRSGQHGGANARRLADLEEEEDIEDTWGAEEEEENSTLALTLTLA